MSETIASIDDFKKTKAGQWKRWHQEMDSAEKAAKKFHKQANKTVAKYLNESDKGSTGETPYCFKLNLFHSNITTVSSMMFGKLPEITFNRTHTDADDDIARVAGMIFERILNADIGTPNDEYSQALRQNLQDRLISGLGVSRVRYTFEEEEIEVSAVTDMMGNVIQEGYSETRITDERAPIDYVHWRDFRWQPARTWKDVNWVAFRTKPTKDQLIKRFGKEVADLIPLSDHHDKDEVQFQSEDEPHLDAYMRAELWEIWDKKNKKVIWWCKGYQYILDEKDDPLGVAGFFPIPEPMVSNVTTSAFMPIPDYVMAQDLYNEIDNLENRITIITEAIKVVGVYDSSAEGVKRMLTEGVENDLIPIDNWAMFAEKGGLKGTVDWMPIEEIANVLNKLVERRNDAKALLYEIAGISDIMRGAQQAGGAVTATERALEARFASVRIQAMQDEFATYATELIRLRAQVIKKHFQPESILTQSNIMHTADREVAPQAVMAIKDDETLIWRIEVKPESVAMVDYAQLKQERTNYITALATFMQSAAPLVQMAPESAPVLLGLLKWGMAGFKGSQDVEGILDQAINMVKNKEKEQGQEPPSPEQIKAQQEQQKMQHDMQMKQMEQQFEKEKWAYEQQMKQIEHQFRMQEIQASSNADLTQEEAQAALNIAEEQNETQELIKRERAKARLAPRTESA